jgi:hypothetical protein
VQQYDPRMTLDELCAEAKGLTPRAANMASVMLRMVGPMSSGWHAALVHSLELAACSDAPLAPNEIEDVLNAAIHPEKRADWLHDNDDFVLAHRYVVNAHLAAEKWKSIVMTLLDEENDNSRH